MTSFLTWKWQPFGREEPGCTLWKHVWHDSFDGIVSSPIEIVGQGVQFGVKGVRRGRRKSVSDDGGRGTAEGGDLYKNGGREGQAMAGQKKGSPLRKQLRGRHMRLSSWLLRLELLVKKSLTKASLEG